MSEDLLWTNTWDGRGMFKLLNMLFKNSITSEHAKVEIQPEKILIPLRPHQRAVISAMEKLEKESHIGHPYKNYKTYSNFGFIGDEVGTGKSLMVLSHIARMKNEKDPIITNRLVGSTCGNLFTLQQNEISVESSTLVVVPHTIFRQWQQYTKDHTNLKVFAVKSRANLNIDTFEENIKKNDFTLVSNTLYGEVCALASQRKITWKRIFFDEADSIHITSGNDKPNAGFVWFITASWANFILHGAVLRSYLNTLIEGPTAMQNLDPEMMQWIKNEMGSGDGNHYTWLRMKSPSFFKEFMSQNIFRCLQVLRCREQFIQESMTMPPINSIQIICEQPPQQRAVQGLVSRDIQQMLHAGDIAGALDNLGVKSEEPKSLLEAFTTQQEKELDRLKKTLAFKESIEYASVQAKETAISSLQIKIKSIEQQIKTFKERIETLNNELCPMCYDDLKTPTMTPCCHRTFCGECMLSALTRTNACPMCRTEITTNKLILLSDVKPKKKKEVIKNQLMRKPDALLDFIIKNPTAKILVFSRYENPFATLSLKCAESGIGVFVLKGNKDCIANTIKEFEEGTKRVLFLPTEYAAAGMNLVAASHVILYHAMTPEEERQVIGRAYRLGRKDPLSVVRLVHEAET